MRHDRSYLILIGLNKFNNSPELNLSHNLQIFTRHSKTDIDGEINVNLNYLPSNILFNVTIIYGDLED